MRAKLVKALIKKEFLDVLRDKKAVAMMILVPLILYPQLLNIYMIVFFVKNLRCVESSMPAS